MEGRGPHGSLHDGHVLQPTGHGRRLAAHIQVRDYTATEV